ncbi:MAG: hypothetical protein OXN84_20825 [Albidovulum sp.]|nr:hypothetical protein [Albidovulum sp.]
MSASTRGTQWNIELVERDGNAYLGVNLEGLKYGGRPAATLLLSELESPSLENFKSPIGDPGSVDISFTKEAWQVTRRPKIEERHMVGNILSPFEPYHGK